MVLSMRFGGTTCTTQSRPVRLKATVTALVSASVDNQKLTFRQATSKDSANISKMVIKERMNPLGLPAERFIIAEDVEGQLMGIGQLQQQPSAQDVQFLELRTLIVTDAARGQGVGTAVMKHLLDTPAAVSTNVFLVTLQRTIPFYQRAGFEEVSKQDIPRALWFEAVAGTAVAFLVARDRLVVLKRPAPQATMDAPAAKRPTLL